MPYLMSVELFNQLTYVQGFTNLNGKNYAEHVLLILKDVLSVECNKEIMNIKPDVNIGLESLKILDKYNINYTHDMESSHT
jgi:hypothetical protein